MATKGPSLVIKQGDGATPTEVFTVMAGVRTKTIRMGTSRIETTSDDDIALDGVSLRTYTSGISEFSADISGVAKSAAASKALVADGRTGAVRNYEVVWPDVGTWEGAMFLSDFQVTASYDGIVEFTANLSNEGPVDWTPEA